VEGTNILIDEDEAELAELIRHHFEWEGTPARTVPPGQRALDSIGRSRSDLVVLDLMLARTRA
jgi:DNA-binding response OmpR family regulator